MILQASNGCYLTENFEVELKNRRFLKSILVASQEEAALWKEITELEKESIVEEGKMFEVANVDYNYLMNVTKMLSVIRTKINSANLTAEQALEMQQYYPKWEDELGTPADAGFRFVYQDTLLEVVTPHTLSEEINPGQQPMLLTATTTEDSSKGFSQYYKPVVAEGITDTESPAEDESQEMEITEEK